MKPASCGLLLGLVVVMAPETTAEPIPETRGENVLIVREPRVADVRASERDRHGCRRTPTQLRRTTVIPFCRHFYPQLSLTGIMSTPIRWL
jgi:hypothetical protein